MKNSKKYLPAAIAVGAVILVCVCAAFLWKSYQGERFRIIYIPKVEDNDNDFWTQLLEGASMAAQENDAKLTVLAPKAENDYAGQVRLVEEAISRNPDAIILSPSSMTEITDAANQVVTAGIRLVLIDSELDQNLESAIVSTDNYEAGRKMGAFVAENLPENPVIGIVAHVRGSSTAAEREEGFRDGLGDAQSHVAATVFSDSDYEKAYAVTETLLETYPDMNVLVGLNEYSAVGAARAVRDMGRANEILMVGFDSSMEEIQMLEEGLFEAIVIQKPFNMGYLGVERTIGILHGELEPRQVDSGSELITKDNIYTEENQKLLFPFAE